MRPTINSLVFGGLFLLLSEGILAQDYKALLGSMARWKDNYMSLSGGDYAHFECYQYELGDDSVWNNNNYRVLTMFGIYSLNGADNWNTETFLIREDTNSQQVFVVTQPWSQERLLYDFSVGVGPYPQTFRHPDGGNVIAVDSIDLIDGTHRRFTLSNGEKIIEGIGCGCGFMPKSSTAYEYYYGLVCHSIDGVQDFYPGVSPDCPCDSFDGVEQQQSSKLVFSPSPTDGYSRLDGASAYSRFVIGSMDGRIVVSGLCSSSGSATIDLSNLPSAMYVIEVQGASGTSRIRVIKE